MQIINNANFRDLAQRHHFAYHETKDSSVALPIACINCASAKTLCDKGVPCARCAEKDLPCEARFARDKRKSSESHTNYLEVAQTTIKAPPSPSKVESVMGVFEDEMKTQGLDIGGEESRVPPVTEQAPRSCITCFSAKVRCDKRMPCSRCTAMGVPCKANFARRTAEAANRQGPRLSSSLSEVRVKSS